MKKVSAMLAVVLTATTLWAQSPEKLSYQAVIRNSEDALVTNTQVRLKVSILQASITGSAVYVETQIPETNANGLVSIEIGNGTVVSGEFASIDWTHGPYFIKTEIDPTGGTNYTISGTSQLLSVPYALHAKTADSVIQDVASKLYVDELKDIIYSELLDNGFNGIIEDIEENKYKTIKIGTQIWMAENLRTKKFNNGNSISLVKENAAWTNTSTPAYCWYDNDERTYKNNCGALYNWYTVNTGDLCPTGWHVPTQAEFTILFNFLINNAYGYGGSGDDIAKSLASTSGWETNSTIGSVGNNQTNNNSTGFSAGPSGGRASDGVFNGLESGIFFWSSTGNGANSALSYGIGRLFSNVLESGSDIKCGHPVRCLKD